MLWIGRTKFYILILFCTTLLACTTLSIVSGQTRDEQARSADSFVDSVGVAVHLNYKNTAYKRYKDVVKPRLEELGIRHIRGGVALTDIQTQEKLKDLAKAGIKSTLVMEPERYVKSPAEAVELAKTVAGSIEAVEGPNEWNLRSEAKYKGQNFPIGLQKFQSELYLAIKKDPATAQLNVLGPSIGRGKSGKAASKLGKVACDINNMHSYPGGKIPSSPLRILIPPGGIMCGAKKPFIATETGYHNAISVAKNKQPGISEQAAAKYINRMFLENFIWGIKRTFTYELIDLMPNPQMDNHELHFGLLRNDGSPKPDYIALKNLLSLLKDPERKIPQNTLPKSLDYSLKSISNVHHALLQKTNEDFFLILWQEVPSFDLEAKTNIFVPDHQVSVVLNNQIKQAVIYQPLNSVDPIKRYVNPTRLDLNVPDHPLVIKLTLS